MSEHQRGGSWFSGFLFGAAIGVGFALLTAKRTGEETREMLQTRGQELSDRAMEAKEKAAKLAVEAREQASQKFAEVRAQAEQKVNDVRVQAEHTVADVRERAQSAVQELRRESEYISTMQENDQTGIPNTGAMSHVDDINAHVSQQTAQTSRHGEEKTYEEMRAENEIMEDNDEKTYDL